MSSRRSSVAFTVVVSERLLFDVAGSPWVADRFAVSVFAPPAPGVTVTVTVCPVNPFCWVQLQVRVPPDWLHVPLLLTVCETYVEEVGSAAVRTTLVAFDDV